MVVAFEWPGLDIIPQLAWEKKDQNFISKSHCEEYQDVKL
jgi:hypothetical protein